MPTLITNNNTYKHVFRDASVLSIITTVLPVTLLLLLYYRILLLLPPVGDPPQDENQARPRVRAGNENRVSLREFVPQQNRHRNRVEAQNKNNPEPHEE